MSSTSLVVPGQSILLLLSQLLYLLPMLSKAQGMWNRDLLLVCNRSPLLLPPCTLPPLQCGSFPWAAVLKYEPVPTWALNGLQFLSVNIHLLHYGPPWAAVWIVPLHNCRGNFFSSFSSLSLTLVLTGFFPRSFPITLHCHAVVCLFSHTPSRGTSMAEGSAVPAVGHWSWLEPAVSSMGQPQPLLTKGIPICKLN